MHCIAHKPDMRVPLLWCALRPDFLPPISRRARARSSRVHHEVGVTNNFESFVTVDELVTTSWAIPVYSFGQASQNTHNSGPHPANPFETKLHFSAGLRSFRFGGANSMGNAPPTEQEENSS